MATSTKIPITKLMLILLAKTGAEMIDFFIFMQSIRRYQSAFIIGGKTYVKELQRLKDKKVARQALWNLRNRNYVKAKQIGNKLIISLTKKGHMALIAKDLSYGNNLPKGHYTVVAFDIPVSQI